MTAHVRRARAVIARLLQFAPFGATDDEVLNRLRGRGRRGVLVSRAVKVEYVKVDRGQLLRYDLQVASGWIAELRGNGIGAWPALERHFAWLMSALERHPPVPSDLARALGKERPALYRQRLEAAFDMALRFERPIAVLAALWGSSEDALKQRGYMRKTVRVPFLRFRSVSVGGEHLMVREAKHDAWGRPTSVLLSCAGLTVLLQPRVAAS